MRARAATAFAALLLALTSCSGTASEEPTRESTAASASASQPSSDPPPESATTSDSATTPEDSGVDCEDPNLSQAEWTEHCATGTEDVPEQETELKFSQSYEWPDGLKVSVVDAKVFTNYDPEGFESAEPGYTDFRVTLKVENTGDKAVALDALSLIVEGATNGGEAAVTVFDNGSQPLEGRLAPGVTTTKNDDYTLETKYGKAIVITVDRLDVDYDGFFESPEFTGQITG